MSTPRAGDKPDGSPRRIQRKRTKGWRMPAGAIYVGRPTIFGNPFRVIKSECCPTWDVADDNGVTYVIDHKWAHANNWSDLDKPGAHRFALLESVRLYSEDLLDWFGGRIENDPDLHDAIVGLAGHDLACWCPLGQPCHADLLLRIANGGDL